LRDSLDLAEQQIRTVIRMSPGNMVARKYLGGILSNRGKYEEAAKVLRSVLGRTDMDKSVRLLYGSCLANLQRLDEALEIFRQISDENPAEPQPAISAARILMEIKDYQSAEVYLRRAVENNPDNLEILRMAIGAYLGAGNLAQARELLLVETRKEPSARAFLVLADVCRQMGLVDECKSWLEKTLALDLPPELRTRVEGTLKNM
ncbi:MAG: tetratricopeptide repeat protein, partial [Candidatus Glassbacteria bacterium]|nr:tetratricopeptide repeat protein [Candidatus Glassbacteria bacterium]